MKKLLLAMALLMTAQAQAGLFTTKKEYIRTAIRCVSAQDANVTYTRVVRESDNSSAFVTMLDYSFWPQQIGENKQILITKTGSSDVVGKFEFGPGASSAVTFPLEKNDGDKYYCNILMTKYEASAPISIP